MTHAIVLIEAERHAIPHLGGVLADVEGVAEAYSVTGEWDFVAILRVREADKLAELITGRLAQLDGIRRTHTMVAFEVFSQHDLEALFSIGELMRRPLVLGAVLAALAASGCGGGDEEVAGGTPTPTPTPTPESAEPTASAPSAPDPPPDSATPEPSQSPEAQEGGAGDEEAIRVPVDLTVTASAVRPRTVAVPGFLALELRVRNTSGREVTVTVEGAEPPGTLTVAAGATGTLRLAGLRPGRYPIDAGSAGAATLVAGEEAGP